MIPYEQERDARSSNCWDINPNWRSYKRHMFNFIVFSLTCGLVQSAGFATYNTDSDGFGKCTIPAGSYDHWTSVGPAAFKGSQICGSCVNVTNTDSGKSTVVHVVDQCLGCGEEDLNLSLPAFTSIGSNAPNHLPISWSIVRCPDVTGNIQYFWETGSNQWWSALQVRNHAEAVASVSYSKSDTGPWKEFTRRDDNYFTTSGIATPVFFNITSTTGKSIIDSNMIPLEQGGIVSSSAQF
ncbi:hypothetical protein DSO57_1023845 [Entomophthora muscae]|uniref:Uncharacterized protein n=1 Tax=Entomophthora muscae TaxID=34485 RepID=A0ACC2S4S4_9FUNG|nr:hypothetical protein DSO57_1023845 [Entomophthora muscae]